MKNQLTRFLTTFLSIAALVVLTACGDSKVEDDLENAAGDMKDAAENAAEATGDAVKDAAKATSEAAEDAADKLKDATN